MTPAARIAAAIEILDQALGGAPTERVLTNWARSNRYAGSGDRAAIRDLVYDAVRSRRSFAALGGAETGRGLMIGALRAQGIPPETMFTGEGYGPPVLTDAERAHACDLNDASDAVRLDVPDWLMDSLLDSLGATLPDIAMRLKQRAPLFLRANLIKGDRVEAIFLLKDQGIFPKVHPLSPTALIVTEGARRVQQSEAYLSGLVEIQDVASQAVVDALCLRPGARVLDYCAGGGGKALAMAAQVNGAVFVHDANPGRMSDLGARAERAGADLRVLKNHAEAKSKGPFDLVLADVPCSGSGAWRRQPDAKWALTPAMLNDLLATQRDILTKASALVAPHGLLAYATCSLLDLENAGQIDRFVSENPQWQVLSQRNFTPLDGGDGLFVAQLTRVEA